MIIDDIEEDRYILKRLLKKAGLSDSIYEFDSVNQAILSLKSLDSKKIKVSIIFLDLNLYLKNGFEFLEEFNQLRHHNKNLKEISVVIISTSQNKNDLQKATQYRFVKNYLTKPIGLHDIKHQIRDITDNNA